MDKSARWVFGDEEGTVAPLAQVPELILLGYDRFHSAMPLDKHHHDQCYEFVYMESGQATWEVEHASFMTNSGMYLLTRPNEKHSARMNHIEPCSIWWFIITDPISSSSWLNLNGIEKQDIAERIVQLPRTGKADSRIRNTLQRMRRTLEQRSSMTELTVRHLLLDIILSILFPSQDSSTSVQLTEAVLQLSSRIQQSPSLSWTTREIADELYVSESHVYRLFNEIHGQSPAAFVTRTRIDKACSLLANSDIAITDIAMELGYKTSQHFSTVFKKYTGKTPGEWRKATRKPTT